MAKWADYLVSAVRYESSATGRHISHLRIHEDGDEMVGTAITWTKNQVATSINSCQRFKTIYKNPADRWRMGEDIRVIIIDNEYFLRTDANRVKADNLGELPEF